MSMTLRRTLDPEIAARLGAQLAELLTAGDDGHVREAAKALAGELATTYAMSGDPPLDATTAALVRLAFVDGVMTGVAALRTGLVRRSGG